MEQGWIKSYRKIMDNQFLMTDNNAFIVFVKLLHLANKNTGQYTTGRFALADRVNMNPNTLYSVLVRLENQHLINITSNNKYSVISICNWKKYQATDNTTDNIAATTGQQLDNNTATLNKNKKENKNKKLTTNVVSPAKPVRYGDSSVNEMFDYWEKIVGYPIKSKVKSNRNACSTMLKSRTIDDMKRLVNGVAIAHEDRYAPSLADFVELQANMNRFLAWGHKRQKQRNYEGLLEI